MTISVGTQKKVAYKKEVTFGVDPGPTGAQYLRRVTSNIDLSKATYQSAELRTDFQVSDMRHGARVVGGNLKDELSCSTFKDWMAAITRAAWVAGTAVTTGPIVTLSSQAGPPETITRSAGSFFTDGFRIGDIITMSGWATTMVGANARAYIIVNLTALVMTIDELTNTSVATIVTKAAGDTVTILRASSKTMVPLTGHTNDSFTIEHQYTDIVQSERFNGCRINSCDIALPSTGMATIDWNVMGQNAVAVASTGYFTTPTAPTSTAVMAAVNGALVYNGTVYAIITAASLKIEAGMKTGTVVGSNQTPDVFVGRVRASGQISAYFQDNLMRDDFWNETTPALTIALASDNAAVPASFFVINMPKIKLGAFTRADSEQEIIATAPFTALLNATGGASNGTDATTFSFQDSTF